MKITINKNKIRYITATSDEYISKSRLPISLQERLFVQCICDAEYEKVIGRAKLIDSHGNINCYACENCTNCKNCTFSNVYKAVYEFYYEKVKIRSVYIHDDGHPDVAAMYLNRALKNSDCNDKYESYDFKKTYDFITKFEKSNDGEITAGYEECNSIKYIYKIDLPMQQITTLELMWGKFEKIEVCSIKEFLKRHNKLLL